jgi:hypothetical protein
VSGILGENSTFPKFAKQVSAPHLLMSSWLVAELLVSSKEFSLFIFTSSRVVIWNKETPSKGLLHEIFEQEIF